MSGIDTFTGICSLIIYLVFETTTNHIRIGSSEQSSVSFRFHFNDLPSYEDTFE